MEKLYTAQILINYFSMRCKLMFVDGPERRSTPTRTFQRL